MTEKRMRSILRSIWKNQNGSTRQKSKSRSKYNIFIYLMFFTQWQLYSQIYVYMHIRLTRCRRGWHSLQRDGQNESHTPPWHVHGCITFSAGWFENCHLVDYSITINVWPFSVSQTTGLRVVFLSLHVHITDLLIVMICPTACLSWFLEPSYYVTSFWNPDLIIIKHFMAASSHHKT